ncbi:MAG: glycosyltransferase family 4 protein, partial [Planctomycetaceae bacterium]
MGPTDSTRWIVAQIGARRHYAVPAALSNAGLLACLYTDLHAGHSLAKLAGAIVPERFRPAPLRSILSRGIADVPAERICTLPGFTLRSLMRRSRNEGPGDAYRRWASANRAFNRTVVRSKWPDAGGVYVFNGAGLEILERAKQLGLRTIVDQTDAPFSIEERLLDEERERWPGWERGRITPSDWEPMAERERAEWNLADMILCGSEYVRDGVAAAGGPGECCRVIPYGFGHTHGATPNRMLRHPARELNVLFAGTLCLRKGIPYFGEAARRLSVAPVRFRAVGTQAVSESALGSLERYVEVAGTVPRSRMVEQYEWADVVVLPSISEGSANVCYEALAHGVPVVTTPHAGSVVRDGRDGFIVPIRDVDALVEVIER